MADRENFKEAGHYTRLKTTGQDRWIVCRTCMFTEQKIHFKISISISDLNIKFISQ